MKPATGGLTGAIARGEQVKREWTKDGTLLTPRTFARRRQTTVDELLNAEARGELFSMRVEGRPYYVAELLKFAPAAAAALCVALGTEDPASKMIFLMRKHGMLDGKTVAEAFRMRRHGRCAEGGGGMAGAPIGCKCRRERVEEGLLRPSTCF